LPGGDSIIVNLFIYTKSTRAPSGLWGFFELQGFDSKRRRVMGTGLQCLIPWFLRQNPATSSTIGADLGIGPSLLRACERSDSPRSTW
jgi:hypothetical protein